MPATPIPSSSSSSSSPKGSPRSLPPSPRTRHRALSDFKSNEYANLIGGDRYEPHEENPMLGFRGASRYVATVPALLRARVPGAEAVRDEMGLTNVEIMVPFVRTVDEGRQVVALWPRTASKRGENGLTVIMMCEIPSNACWRTSSSNTSTACRSGPTTSPSSTLGLDRDSAIVAASSTSGRRGKAMLSMAITACKAGKYIGICGQGPSDHPDLARVAAERGHREHVAQSRHRTRDLALSRRQGDLT